MKKMSFLLFLILHSSQAQTTKFHYVLNDGDVFQYHVDAGGALVGNATVIVIGDTIMPNGKTYKIMKSNAHPVLLPTKHIRIAHEDSVLQFVRTSETGNKEILLCRLNMTVGMRWPSLEEYGFNDYQEITAIRDTTLWGHSFRYAVVGGFLSEDSTLQRPNDLLIADTLGIFFDSYELGRHSLLSNSIYLFIHAKPAERTKK